MNDRKEVKARTNVRAKRGWRSEPSGRLKKWLDIFGDIYEYLKALGYESIDFRSLEEVRQVMSIDGLKAIAVEAGASTEKARAKSRSLAARRSWRERIKARRRADARRAREMSGENNF